MAALGELEHRIMQVLWASATPLTVRAVHEVLRGERDLAYTTVMTVLDRLAKKNQVTRQQEGRAWLYRPAMTRAEHAATSMLELVDAAGPSGADAVAEFVRRLPVELTVAAREALGR